MSKNILSAFALAAAVLAGAATTGATDAEAGIHVRKDIGFHKIVIVKPYAHSYYRPVSYVAPVAYYGGHDCSAYWHRWQSTGYYHWKKKYLVCKGLW